MSSCTCSRTLVRMCVLPVSQTAGCSVTVHAACAISSPMLSVCVRSRLLAVCAASPCILRQQDDFTAIRTVLCSRCP